MNVEDFVSKLLASGKFNYPVTIHPDWYYSYVTIPNFKAIQEELLVLARKDVKFYWNTPEYYNISPEDCIPLIPHTVEYLREIGLFNQFHRIMVPHQKRREDIGFVGPPHLDSNRYGVSHCSLNIPLHNCEDSWTIWYEATDGGAHLNYTYKFVGMAEELARPIAAVQYTGPALVNTSIHHRGYRLSLDRLFASIRFNPGYILGKDDMMKFGIKNPLEQVDPIQVPETDK